MNRGGKKPWLRVGTVITLIDGIKGIAMFCWRCGKAMREKGEFCGNCGASAKTASVDNPATSTVSASPQSSTSHDAVARHKLWIVLGVCVAALALLFTMPVIIHKMQSAVAKSKQEQEKARIAEAKAQYPVVDAIEHNCQQFTDGNNVLTRSADYSTIYYSWVTNGDTMASLAVFSCIAEQGGLGTDLETAPEMMSTTLAMASRNFGYGIIALEKADYSQLSDQMSARCVLDINKSEVLCQIIDGNSSPSENAPDAVDDYGSGVKDSDNDASALMEAMPGKVGAYTQIHSEVSKQWNSYQPIEEYTIIYGNGLYTNDITLIVAQWKNNTDAQQCFNALDIETPGEYYTSGDVKVSGETAGSYVVKTQDNSSQAIALWRNDTAVFKVTGGIDSVVQFYQDFPL